MSEEYKILYKEYEIAYTANKGIVNIEVKDNETGKIYHSKCKLFKVIKELQQELTKYKERCEKAVELLKRKLIDVEIYGEQTIDVNEILTILEDKEKE